METPFKGQVHLDNLRKCQREAYEAITAHYQGPGAERNVIVQLPTGAGKTALVAATPFGTSKTRVLILTPSVKLARDMAQELDIIGNRGANAYRRFKMLSADDLTKLEMYVLRLESSAAAGDIEEHHIIVANYHQLQDLEKWFAGKRDCIDLIIIDEAHHQAAATYQEIVDFFPHAKVVGLTATPFRSDGKRIEGKFIYKYTFNEAIKDGIIRNLRVVNVAPENIELVFTDEDRKTYNLKDVLNLKEEAWFRRGIALSQDCCDSIARKAADQLEELRREFKNDYHQIIAAAMSKRHAREYVKPAFEKLALTVGLVSSSPEDTKTNEEVFRKLRAGKIDVIIHIGMLGEGFDHPPLGIAAIFRPYQTLNPYIQFVGRVLKKNGQTPHSFIVSHLGLNQLRRFEEFKMFDYEDQAFMQHLFAEGIGAEATFVNPDTVRRIEYAAEDVPTVREIGERTLAFETQFVGEHAVNEVLNKFDQLDNQGKEAFLIKLGISPKSVKLRVSARDARIKPVDKRRAARRLLNEKEKSITADILKELRLKSYGRDFNKLFPNFAWVKKRVSKTLNNVMEIQGGQRQSITNPMFESIEDGKILADVCQENLNYFRGKLKTRS